MTVTLAPAEPAAAHTPRSRLAGQAVPLAVYYGQEVRMYSQVIALGLLAALAYLRRRFVWYAPCAAAAIYSHYLGLTIVAALNLHALVWWRSMGRHRWLGWLAANLSVAL